MKQVIRPLHDRIVVLPEEKETVSKGGIIIPDTAQDKPMKGKVVAVGKGLVMETGIRAPMDIEIGDTVYYGKYAGTEMRVDGQLLLIMRQSDAFCCIDEVETNPSAQYEAV
jgi:chaperonin GroES